MAQLDLDSLVTLGDLAGRWRDTHRGGKRHMDNVPGMYAAATKERSDEDNDWRKKKGVAHRVMMAAPSPRLEAFLDSGWQHPSVAAAAPQKLTDAIEGAVAAARTCEKIFEEAERTLDAFVKSCSIGEVPENAAANPNRHWMDAVPVPVLFTAVPWGDPPHRTIEQWLWLCTAVVEALGEENKVKKGVADYLSQLPGGGEDGDHEVEPLTREKLEGCAEVWAMEPFLDRDLFNTLANAGK